MSRDTSPSLIIIVLQKSSVPSRLLEMWYGTFLDKYIGGFAGTGKTTITRRLSAELHLPRLGSDTIGRTIKASRGMPSDEGDAYWIEYAGISRPLGPP